MASSIIGALRAVLGLDTAQFEAGADRAAAKSGVLRSALMEGAAALTEFVAPAALATAGVAALARGMEAAKASLDFADELDATSTKIGITAESLQTLRFAAQDADIDAATLDSSMQSLNATLGALQSGIGDAKIRKAFEALGIPQSQIDGMRDASDLLPLLADHISKVGSQAEQVQIAKKLGIEDLLPLLQRGADGLRELEDQARSLGIVLESSVVTRMADLSREMEITELRSKAAGDALGFALAPALIAAKNGAADLLVELTSIIERFKEIDQRSGLGLTRQRDSAYWKMSTLLQGAKGNTREGLDWFGRAQYDAAKKRYDEAQAELDRRRFEPPPSTSPPTASVASGSRGGGPDAKIARPAGPSKAADDDKFPISGKSYELFLQQFKKSIIATAEDPLVISEPLSNAVEDGVGDGLIAARQTAYDVYRDTFASAIDAGLRGGSKGVLDWLGWQLSRSISDMLATMGANAATSGGWLGKAFTSIGSLLGIGNNADGTTNWRGGMTWVGERGPELLSLPRGSAITPAHLVDAQPGGGLVVSVTPSDLFDVTVRRVSREEAQSAGVQAVQASTGLSQEKQARAAMSRLR